MNKIGSDIDGEAAGDQSGRSVSLSADGSIVAIGADENAGNGVDSGHVRIYQWSGSAWVLLGADIDGEAAGERSGRSVSLSADGSMVAIGAPFNDGNGTSSGHVRIYRWSGSAWVQLGTDIDGEAALDQSGFSVSMSADGGIVAIGAGGNAGNGVDSGHVRIYQWSGSAWIQLGTDIDGEAVGDQSGQSVSLSADGGMVAIGARGNDSNGVDSGHVRIYRWSGSAWVQLGTDIDGEAADDQSGQSVSLSADGGMVAIGALNNDGNGNSSGHVRIYQWSGSAWVQLGTDIDGEAAFNLSGFSVSMSADGGTVVIGAFGNDDNGSLSGHVRIYRWSGSAWVQLGTDIDGEAAEDRSGRSVSLSADGSRLAIGAPTNNGNGDWSGHVRIFALAAKLSDYFVTTWKTDNSGTTNATSITVAMVGGPYDVDWNNDGVFDETGLYDRVTHDYGVAGTYTIRIRGIYDSIFIDDGWDNYTILSVDQWGTNSWKTMFAAFWGAENLRILASDTPDFSAVTDMSWMFTNATSVNLDTSDWNVTSLTDASDMFSGVTLSTANYDKLLVGWNDQALKSGVVFSGGNSTYCLPAASAARANMIASDSWVITDGGQACPSGCYPLTLSHTDSGTDPFVSGTDPDASPRNSAGCTDGNYIAGESISLTAYSFEGWAISGWTGTSNDATTVSTIELTMPASSHAVNVQYVESQHCAMNPERVWLDENMETGEGDWTHFATVPGNDKWQLGIATANSPTHAWRGGHGPDTLGVTDQSLVSPDVIVPVGVTNTVLSFYNKRDLDHNAGTIHSCFDGAVLEYSTNGGVNWLPIESSRFLSDAYDGLMDSITNPLVVDRQAWCGVQDWTLTEVDLTGLEGETLNFRFRVGTDNFNGTNDGWHIDDVKVFGCVLPEPEGPIIFVNGFED